MYSLRVTQGHSSLICWLTGTLCRRGQATMGDATAWPLKNKQQSLPLEVGSCVYSAYKSEAAHLKVVWNRDNTGFRTDASFEKRLYLKLYFMFENQVKPQDKAVRCVIF